MARGPFLTCSDILRLDGKCSIFRVWEHKSRLTLADILCDYAKLHQSVGQLPELQRALEMAEMHDALLVMDDLRRLFRPVPYARRDAFFDELMAAGGRLIDLRTGLTVVNEPDVIKPWLRVSGDPVPYAYNQRLLRKGLSRGGRFKARRIAQTEKARRASIRARREQALSRAREIARVRDEVLESGQRPTLAAIAEAANAKGMRTARGNPWSTSSVSKALKRLAEEADNENEAALRHGTSTRSGMAGPARALLLPHLQGPGWRTRWATESGPAGALVSLRSTIAHETSLPRRYDETRKYILAARVASVPCAAVGSGIGSGKSRVASGCLRLSARRRQRRSLPFGKASLLPREAEGISETNAAVADHTVASQTAPEQSLAI